MNEIIASHIQNNNHDYLLPKENAGALSRLESGTVFPVNVTSIFTLYNATDLHIIEENLIKNIRLTNLNERNITRWHYYYSAEGQPSL